MTENRERRLAELTSSLKQDRDELKLQLHLLKKEMQEEWDRLEEKFVDLNARLEPSKHALEKSSENLWESLKLVGEELRDGYRRIRNSL